jgi:hypothetical protein
MGWQPCPGPGQGLATLGKVVARFGSLGKDPGKVWHAWTGSGQVLARPGLVLARPGLVLAGSGLTQDLPGQGPAQYKNFTPVPKLNLLVTFEFFLLHSLILIPPYMWGCPAGRAAARGGRLRRHKAEK